MHHLILVREVDQQMSGSGCCGRIEGDMAVWGDGGCVFPERREGMNRFGEIYRAVRREFGDAVEITFVDPRNFVSFIPLVIRDAFRFRVPIGTVLRAIAANSLATGVLDGQLLFTRKAPSPQEVVDMIASRLVVHHVGATS